MRRARRTKSRQWFEAQWRKKVKGLIDHAERNKVDEGPWEMLVSTPSQYETIIVRRVK